MKYRVACYYRHEGDQLKEKIGDSFDDMEFTFYHVNTLADLKEIFLRTEREYDGFLSNGLFSDQYISKLSSRPGTPHEYLRVTVESYYRYLLTCGIQNPEFMLSRTRFDLMEPDDDLTEIVLNNRLQSMIDQERELIRGMELEEVEVYEKFMIDRHLKAYEEGKADLFITGSTLAVAVFNEKGIPYHRAELTFSEIESKLRLLKSSIELHSAKISQAAMVYFAMEDMSRRSEQSQYYLRFQQAIYDYAKEHGIVLNLKTAHKDFEIYTDAQTVKRLTEDYTVSPLHNYLRKVLGFRGGVGYGIGMTQAKASENAREAATLSYRSAADKQFMSYVVTEDHRVHQIATGSVQGAEQRSNVVDGEVISNIASACRLSSENVYRVVELCHNLQIGEISSEILVKHLGMSLRTANKVLSHLCDGGVLYVARQKHLGQKGRPINVFRFREPEKLDITV